MSSTSTSASPAPSPAPATVPAGEEQTEKDKEKTSGDYYFDSYAHHSIHEEMLKDDVRTRSYRDAILNNAHLFKGKIVLDVGCGTGILSLFAAKAGAQHVYGVECSAIAEQAEEIVKVNNYSHLVTIVRGKVEDITLPVDKVDIIISEWMGYFLVYESMLNTVLVARDRWLSPDGVLFPDKAKMYICGIEDAQYKEEKIGWWENVWGFNFSPIKRLAMLEPLVDVVEPQQIVTSTCPFWEIDLATVTVEDLSFSCEWAITANCKDLVHALVAWFDVTFSKGHQPLSIATGPSNRGTHWKQTVFYLNEPIAANAGEKLSGQLTCGPNRNNARDLDITLKLDFDGAHPAHYTQDYRLR